MSSKKKTLTPHVIRQLDYWVGVPICFALTLVRTVLSRLWPRAERREPVRKILFIKMTEQGATVLAWPAIRRAVETVGRDNVYFWVFRENRPILELLDVIPARNIIDLRADRPFEFLLDLAKSLVRIRRLGIDGVVDLEFFSRASAILGYLSGAARRCGFHRFTSEAPYRGDLLTHRVQYNPYLHMSETFRILVDSLSAPPDQVPLLKQETRGLAAGDGTAALPDDPQDLLHFEPTEAERAALWQLLQARTAHPIGHPIVLLNPNASDMLPLRKWPTERFEQLARRIIDEMPEATVVFTGSPSEAAEPERMVRDIASPRVISLAGRTTLRQLLTLYQVADVLVTNDSGPGHFSSMTDIHAIIMFGPETPLLFGPMAPHADVVWMGLACSPCVSVFNHRLSPCNDNRCMTGITVDRVMERIRRGVPQARRS